MENIIFNIPDSKAVNANIGHIIMISYCLNLILSEISIT